MSAMSNYLENKLIDHNFRGIPFTAPSTLYFALLTAAASDTGGGTEATGGSYARVGLACNATNWAATDAVASTVSPSAGASGTTSNNAVVTFPAPTANWGVATNFAIYDASTGGNLLWYGALSTAKTINNADAAPSFAASQFSLQLDN